CLCRARKVDVSSNHMDKRVFLCILNGLCPGALHVECVYAESLLCLLHVAGCCIPLTLAHPIRASLQLLFHSGAVLSTALLAVVHKTVARAGHEHGLLGGDGDAGKHRSAGTLRPPQRGPLDGAVLQCYSSRCCCRFAEHAVASRGNGPATGLCDDPPKRFPIPPAADV
ncbi:unnamed protein product, partial [Symbiodinium pilosum]